MVKRNQEQKSMDLLEGASERLTNVVVSMEPGTLRSRLTEISEEFDQFLFDAEDPVVDEIIVDEDDEKDEESNEHYYFDEDDSGAAMRDDRDSR